MEKKVTTLSLAHCFPFSDSTPGEERVAVSRGGEGGTVRPTRTSPRRTPHPWGPLRAAGPPGGPRRPRAPNHCAGPTYIMWGETDPGESARGGTF